MHEENEDQIEQKPFDYCEKVDLHALSPNTNLVSVVSIAAEHGFRGVIVPLGRLDQLIAAIKAYGNKEILPICAIDYPLGASSLDVRNYSIMSAHEKGAREVEIVAPYHFIAEEDFRKVYNDANSVVGTAKKAGMEMKYVLDQNCSYINDKVRSQLARIVSSTRIPIVSTALGFVSDKTDHADNIIKMRNLKSKSGCKIKVYLSTHNVDDIASYVKAGADIIGLEWNKAAYLVHAYEEMVQKKE
jgi:deoxyribose-phosphate aldolase